MARVRSDLVVVLAPDATVVATNSGFLQFGAPVHAALAEADSQPSVQVALNIYMIWGLYVLSSPTNLFGINEKYTARLEYFVFVHYMSKFLDYFDTVFIILRASLHHPPHTSSVNYIP